MRDIRAFNPVGKSFTHLLVCVSLAHVNDNDNVNVNVKCTLLQCYSTVVVALLIKK